MCRVLQTVERRTTSSIFINGSTSIGYVRDYERMTLDASHLPSTIDQIVTDTFQLENFVHLPTYFCSKFVTIIYTLQLHSSNYCTRKA